MVWSPLPPPHFPPNARAHYHNVSFYLSFFRLCMGWSAACETSRAAITLNICYLETPRWRTAASASTLCFCMAYQTSLAHSRELVMRKLLLDNSAVEFVHGRKAPISLTMSWGAAIWFEPPLVV